MWGPDLEEGAEIAGQSQARVRQEVAWFRAQMLADQPRGAKAELDSLHNPPPESRDNGLGLKEIARRAAREAEGAVLKEVLDQVHWNRVRAAQRLKISYKALLYKIREYGLRD